MEPRASRLAKNEALFRGVNERIAEITEEFANREPVDGLVCECADAQCLERIGPLTIEEYERVRADARRFIVAAGHDAPEVERVVERKTTYWIVEKNEGVAAEVVEERDPRS